MHSRKYVILLWVMLLCAVFWVSGCEKEKGEENVLAGVEQADIPSDTKSSTKEGTAEDDAGERTLNTPEETSGTEKAAAGISDADENDMIYVDVCGQVKNPGVYQLTGGSRVYEAVEKAGGMTKEAASASVNQAERLTDGQQIYIPSKDEQSEGTVHASQASGAGGVRSGNAGTDDANDGKVNLNTASKEELMSLTGIGEVKADSIIRYREEQGGFQSAEDIKKIDGIKDGVFNKIKDQITV